MPLVRAAIAAMGTTLGPDILDACKVLFDAEQHALAVACPAATTDIAYGPHQRHRLDIYQPADRSGPVPVVVFVHGGGFLKGDKGSAGHWPNSNVGRMLAKAGMLGIVINYRLAPDDMWPAGADDVAAVVDWISAHAKAYGGDPGRVALLGTSAGAVHVAGCLARHPAAAGRVRSAVLLSGLYGYTPLDPRDTLYYGDPADYPDRRPLEGVATTGVPLFVACAEFDPPRFQTEYVALLQDRLARHGALPRAFIASGHNHYSMAMHLGTSDTRLADEITGFIRDTTA